MFRAVVSGTYIDRRKDADAFGAVGVGVTSVHTGDDSLVVLVVLDGTVTLQLRGGDRVGRPELTSTVPPRHAASLEPLPLRQLDFTFFFGGSFSLRSGGLDGSGGSGGELGA